MKRNFTLPILFLLFTFLSASAQDMLRIQNPNWWDFEGYRGNITEATFTIQPQGAYMEVGMFLTFSDEGLGFSSWDSTEIILDFNLPEGSIVYDSWLWMFDDSTIVRADIHDIWSATTVYENIVDRRRDPSILYRKPSGSYQIRVYPLPNDETRKIKISYLTPAIWSAEEVSAWLPTEILKTSAIPLNSFDVITFPNTTWQNPNLKGVPDVDFQSVTDPNYGDILIATVPKLYINKPFSFAVDAPFNSDGIFVQQLDNGTDKFYQAAFLPPDLPVPSNPKKVVFLVDHEEPNSTIERADLYNYLEEQCKSYLQPEDQFNFIFSNSSQPQMMSDQWIIGNVDSISQAFAQLTNPIEDYSDLFELLENGINFLLNNGEEGEIVLVANSDENNWSSQQAIANINTLLQGQNIKIHIINYQTENFYYEWVWQGPDFWTYNNAQFYHDITLSTGGNLYGSLEGAGNVWANISNALSSLKSVDYDFDMYTSLTNGFTLNRFHQTYLGQSRNVNQPILQIGKYVGSFPFEIEYSASIDGNFIFETVEVPVDQIMEGDSVNREIWFGHHLRNLQSTAAGVSGIQEIIDLSIEERVLTDYTAFLALDLENGAEPCLECWEFDEWIVFSTDDLKDELNVKILAFPNPFTDQVKVSFELGEGFSIDEAELSIFDAFGKNILTQDLSELTNFGKTEWTWNGKNSNGQSLPSGMYYMMIKTDKGAKTVKLTLMR
ncbi:MAG: FlgD immunoglobulin-like domain containing protein [Saprospiraceae bacterium]